MRPRALLVLPAFLALAAGCQAVDAPAVPLSGARPSTRELVPAGAPPYQVIDVSHGAGSGYWVNSSDAVLLRLAIAGDDFGEREWTESQGVLVITAPDGRTLETDATNDRGDLAGFTDDGVHQTPWFRPAGGSFQQIPLPPNAWFYLQRMNQEGDVAGGYVTAQNTSVGFVWSAARGITTFHESAPGDLVIPFGMNGQGEVVGAVQHLSSTPARYDAFTWSASAGFSINNYGAQRAFFTGVNDAGTRVLRILDAPAHEELVNAAGQRAVLPNPFGDSRTTGGDINADGVVAGGAFDPARNVVVPVVWDTDLSVAELPGLATSKGSATAINLQGDVVGSDLGSDGQMHAVLWKRLPTVASIEQLVSRYVGNPGLARSLQAKLEAANAAIERGNLDVKAGVLGAFISEVNAQRGKALSANHATTLVTLVGRL